MNRSEYHAHPGLGSTDVKNLLIHPEVFIHARRSKSEPSAAMSLGTLVHEAILEPHLFDSRVLVTEDLRTKAGKAAREEAIAKGVDWMSQADAAVAVECQRSVRSLIKDLGLPWKGQTETPKLSAWGPVQIKALLDYHDDEGILDLKTTTDELTDEAIGSTIWRYSYWVQAGHYANVCGLAPWQFFRFLFVQTRPPWMARLVEVSPEWLAQGRRREQAYSIAANLSNNNTRSPVFSSRIDLIRPSDWQLREVDKLLEIE